MSNQLNWQDLSEEDKTSLIEYLVKIKAEELELARGFFEAEIAAKDAEIAALKRASNPDDLDDWISLMHIADTLGLPLEDRSGDKVVDAVAALKRRLEDAELIAWGFHLDILHRITHVERDFRYSLLNENARIIYLYVEGDGLPILTDHAREVLRAAKDGK